ncbi:uncharacterized protein LOC112033743 [Quercus suber]|uniref:uncharacterized protein LOC112033743 n=1 Tax=Quercus suber TaxID=58331 RepID=UPI000CE25EC6|nr:uncharacterized protein LOC112033743 [Quercus suber]
MNLKGDLHNLKKGADSVDVYLQKIKVVRDKLLAVGVTIDDEELLHITFKGLPKEFNAFRSAIRTRNTKLSFDELSTMLNAEEESLNDGLNIKDSIFAMAATTPKPSGNFNQNQFNRGRGRGNFNNRGGRGGRGSYHSPQYNQYNPFTPPFQSHQSNPGSSAPRSDRPSCQIYGKLGHIAIDCYHRMDYAYQGKHPPIKLAAMATASNACLA